MIEYLKSYVEEETTKEESYKYTFNKVSWATLPVISLKKRTLHTHNITA